MFFDDIRSVLQPRYCLHCGVPLLAHQSYLCLNCTAHLEETSFHLSPDNPLWQTLRHRCPIEGATSLFFVGKRNVAQDLIHHLKYKGKQEIGEWLGKWLGSYFNENDHIFALRNPERWIGKHLLLVDDVITTGSTLERCYTALSSIPEVKISVASIACAVIK